MVKLLKKFTVLLLVLAFVTVTLLSLQHGMDMRQDGTMSGCMFDQSATCPMNYKEHINYWQQTFTAAQPTQNTMFVLLAVIALGGAAMVFHPLLNRQRYAQEGQYIPQSAYKQREMIAKISDHILQALSNGILNPRLYKFFNITA